MFVLFSAVFRRAFRVARTISSAELFFVPCPGILCRFLFCSLCGMPSRFFFVLFSAVFRRAFRVVRTISSAELFIVHCAGCHPASLPIFGRVREGLLTPTSRTPVRTCTLAAKNTSFGSQKPPHKRFSAHWSDPSQPHGLG